MRRRLIAALAGTVLLTVLSGCALPLPLPRGPVRAPAPVEVLDGTAELEAGSCLGSVLGQIADTEDLVACTGSHSADLVAIVDWPGMDALLEEWPAKTVWDEVSNSYPLKGLAGEYNRWAATACKDAFRELIGWDAIRLADGTAAEIDLLPGGGYEIVAAVADASTFSEGDHRTRCVTRWYEPLSYDAGVTIADIATARFPSDARECYLADDEGNLEYIACDLPHTDQSMVTFDAYDVFGDDVALYAGTPDTGTQERANRFCGDVITAAFGAWNDYNHWVWGGAQYTAQWTALRDAPPTPEAYYPFGCILSAYDGEYDTGDLIAEADR